MARTDREVHVPFSAQNALKFEDSLARQDDLLVGLGLGFEFCLAESQSVTVCGYGTQRLAFSFEQKSVQIVANVLLRHRKMRLVDQTSEITLRQRQRLLRIDLIDYR